MYQDIKILKKKKTITKFKLDINKNFLHKFC